MGQSKGKAVKPAAKPDYMMLTAEEIETVIVHNRNICEDPGSEQSRRQQARDNIHVYTHILELMRQREVDVLHVYHNHW